jgi:hypothetical protein
VSLKTRSTFVLVEPGEITQALVGLKDVRVLHYARSGPDVELSLLNSDSNAWSIDLANITCGWAGSIRVAAPV